MRYAASVIVALVLGGCAHTKSSGDPAQSAQTAISGAETLSQKIEAEARYLNSH